jgi:hypothetical protein
MSRAQRRQRLQGNFPLVASTLDQLVAITEPVGQNILSRAKQYLGHTAPLTKKDSQVAKYWKRINGSHDWKIDSGEPHQYGECLKCRRWLTVEDDDHEFCLLCNPPKEVETHEEAEESLYDYEFTRADLDDDVEAEASI